MKRRIGYGVLITMVLSAMVHLNASELILYRDGAILNQKMATPFVGWTGSEVTAFCKERQIALVPSADCPKSLRLCKEHTMIDHYRYEAEKAVLAEETLKTLVNRLEYRKIESAMLIDASKKIAAGLSRFRNEARRAKMKSAYLEKRFKQQVRSHEGYRLAEPCNGSVRLRLPAGAIDFQIRNIARFVDEKRMVWRETMVVTNRSGIDIHADRVRFVYRQMRQTLRPYRFAPWVVYDGARRPRILAAKAVEAAGERRQKSKIIVKGPRHYEVKNVILPSTGESVEIPLRRQSVTIEYQKIAYPWRDRRVYESVTFDPPSPVVTDRWRILNGDEIAADRVYGRYDAGRYRLFIAVDEDLTVRRERLILKENESFFGNRIHKKDGYILSLTNSSKKKERLHIVERIPVAVRSDVNVKLLKVQSALPMRYRLGKEGRLDIDVTIPPQSGGKITVLFEVDFDKKKRVYY